MTTSRRDPATLGADDCIVGVCDETGSAPRVVYRRAGDRYLLVEYGANVLDLELRFRVHALMLEVEERRLSGVIELTPGIRSLQIHYDSRTLPLASLLDELAVIEDRMGEASDIEVPSRIVHLPLSWSDAAVQKTIDKYMQSVRPDAPWCPSNIEFIRRINGLDSVDDVKRIVFATTYLVLGLGDVYLGAPVATPVDPRHRLVTTKYNPARTWTPDNVVGIGGAYMCIYGMEGPGGYQLYGRTCQVWNTYRTTREFEPEKPWLLRFFDQIRFYPVAADELLSFRDGFLQGQRHLEIEPATFKLADYRTFLAENAESIRAFKASQQAAFDAERARWQASDQAGAAQGEAPGDDEMDQALEPGSLAVQSPVPGAVWKIAVIEGARVAAGDVLIVVESMKMEMTVAAPAAGTVAEVRCAEGRAVALGQTLVVLRRGQRGGGAMTASLDIGALARGYASGAFAPADIVREVYARIEAIGERPIWISLVPLAEALAKADAATAKGRSMAFPSRSRTTSTPPDWRPPAPAPNSPTCPRARPPSSSASRRPAPSSSARPTSTSSRPASSARARPTASPRVPSTLATSPAARARARRWLLQAASSRSRSAPTRRAPGAFPPLSTTSSA